MKKRKIKKVCSYCRKNKIYVEFEMCDDCYKSLKGIEKCISVKQFEE